MNENTSHAWQAMFPPLLPYDEGWLDVGDGHHMHWEVCGHPGAPAALFVHGGPGVGCTAADRRWFDPQRWRVVLFDQRGAGRSRCTDLLRANTTAHLIKDMEALRRHLHIERWTLLGGSSGATLALAYAQQHAHRVRALVLRGVFLATSAERQHLYGSLWRSDDNTAAAARAWWQAEQDLMCAEGAASATPDDKNLLTQARIGMHYARHAWFLQEGQLLHTAHALRGLPGSIVQGREDKVTPPWAARALHAAWPGSRLLELSGAGHASSHPAIARQLILATESLAARFEETLHG